MFVKLYNRLFNVVLIDWNSAGSSQHLVSVTVFCKSSIFKNTVATPLLSFDFWKRKINYTIRGVRGFVFWSRNTVFAKYPLKEVEVSHAALSQWNIKMTRMSDTMCSGWMRNHGFQRLSRTWVNWLTFCPCGTYS